MAAIAAEHWIHQFGEQYDASAGAGALSLFVLMPYMCNGIFTSVNECTNDMSVERENGWQLVLVSATPLAVINQTRTLCGLMTTESLSMIFSH